MTDGISTPEAVQRARETEILRNTKSLCPECLGVVDADIFIDAKNTVRIRKNCPTHGYFEDTYTFSSPELYSWAETYAHDGHGVTNPRTETRLGCPYDCGLCPNHKSHTVLAIIDVTNRCNLRCPICFANAAAAGYVYEPTKEQIRGMLENFRANRPVSPPALQYSGGEPTVRNDLPELVRMAKEAGFDNIEVNTNGVRFARDIDFFKEVYDAGMNTIYLQFDGLDDEIYTSTRGLPLLDTKIQLIENARQLGFDSIVLVVTLVRGINDHQLGDVLNFALENSDVVRCMNIQPVSITGRIPRDEREAMRINTSDFMELLEEQTEGMVTTHDFRPVPSVVPVSQGVGALKEKDYVEFSTSPWCGVATFLVNTDGDDWVPLTKLADVDKFLDSLQSVFETASEGKKTRAYFKALAAIRHVKMSLMRDLIWPVLKDGSYRALSEFMHKVVMIGCMHFMDPYNFDLDRVERCVIHYAFPDGTIRPFCSVNTVHRASIEKRFSVPLSEWKGSPVGSKVS